MRATSRQVTSSTRAAGVCWRSHSTSVGSTLTGGPVSLVDDVAQSIGGTTGAAQFAVSGDGTLVYVPASSLEGHDITVPLGRPDGARGTRLRTLGSRPRADDFGGWWAGRFTDR